MNQAPIDRFTFRALSGRVSIVTVYAAGKRVAVDAAWVDDGTPATEEDREELEAFVKDLLKPKKFTAEVEENDEKRGSKIDRTLKEGLQ